jgi:hypothetical protein
MNLKVEWANTDSRVTLIEDGSDIILEVEYERDTYISDRAIVTIPKDEFTGFMHRVMRYLDA